MKMGKWIFAAAMMMSAALCGAEFSMATQIFKGVTFEDGVYARKIENPTRFCQIGFRLDEQYDENQVLFFEYRVTDPEKLDYVACTFYGADKKEAFYGFKPRSEWTVAKVPLEKMKSLKAGIHIAVKAVVKIGKKKEFHRLSPLMMFF